MHLTAPRRRSFAVAAAIGAVALLAGPVASVQADPVASGTASAFGVTVSAAGEQVVPPTPEQSIDLPPGGESDETVVDVPADPVAVSGTLNADVAVHAASDLDSRIINAESSQSVEGPYNARAEGLVEGLDVLIDVAGQGVSVLSADAVRAEAVGVCRDGEVEYSASSEIVGLSVAGELLPVNGPLQDLVDAIGDLLEQTGLEAVVDVQRNVVNVDADGASVDALVVTVLAAVGDPLAEVRVAHAEVGGLECGEAPECSDGEDNDGDDAVDFPADPGCESPEDDSEIDGPAGDVPECSDGTDNDGDGAVDFPADPGCTDEADDSEQNAAAPAPGPAPAASPGDLPRTGGDATPALIIGSAMAAVGAGAHRLRRRLN